MHVRPHLTRFAKAWDAITAIIDPIPEEKQVFSVISDYNTFRLFAERSSEGNKVDILVIWQVNYYGKTFIMYGSATSDNFGLIQFANIDMNHFGISINPMPRQLYDKLSELESIQQELSDMAKHEKNARIKKLMDDFKP